MITQKLSHYENSLIKDTLDHHTTSPMKLDYRTIKALIRDITGEWNIPKKVENITIRYCSDKIKGIKREYLKTRDNASFISMIYGRGGDTSNGQITPWNILDKVGNHLKVHNLIRYLFKNNIGAILVTGLLLINTISHGQIVTDGLVGYWPANAYPQVDFANSGTIHGATLTDDRNGNAFSAYNFDGDGDHVDLGNDPKYDLVNNFTVSVWVKPNTLDQRYDWPQILFKPSLDSLNRPLRLNWANNTKTLRFVWRVNGDWRVLKIIENIDSLGWFHCVLTMSDSTATAYLNGVNVGSIKGILPPSSPDNLTISKKNNNSWNGKVDELAIYNRPLSPQEVQQLYNDYINMPYIEQLYYNDGNIGIGTDLTSNPNNYKLAVNGSIGAKEVKVEATSTTWPDYVFHKDYKLLSIYEIQSFIDKHHHLPGMPSENQVNSNGINLGQMDALLLRKIEELTLYLIEKDRENRYLNERIHQLTERIEKLESQIKNQ